MLHILKLVSVCVTELNQPQTAAASFCDQAQFIQETSTCRNTIAHDINKRVACMNNTTGSFSTPAYILRYFQRKNSYCSTVTGKVVIFLQFHHTGQQQNKCLNIQQLATSLHFYRQDNLQNESYHNLVRFHALMREYMYKFNMRNALAFRIPNISPFHIFKERSSLPFA